MIHIKLLSIFILIFSSISFSKTELIGAGATFPYPLYSKMFSVYYKNNTIKVNYQSIGSGGGIKQLENKTVHFCASEAFLKQDKINNKQILHIPVCIGAVSITYNVNGDPQINLTPQLLSEIFRGNIEKWNDPKIRKENPYAILPDQEIIVIHRSDGSGTTFILTDFLAKKLDFWKKNIGKGKTIRWPKGLGAKGNEGVAGLVRQIPGAIGYVQLAYAVQNNMPQASIQNKAGNYIKPSISTIKKAIEGTKIPNDTKIALSSTENPGGYPLIGFSWIIIYKDLDFLKNKKTALELCNLLWWMVHDGQSYTEPLYYVSIPDNVLNLSENIIKKIEYKGSKLIK